MAQTYTRATLNGRPTEKKNPTVIIIPIHEVHELILTLESSTDIFHSFEDFMQYKSRLREKYSITFRKSINKKISIHMQESRHT